MVLVPHGYHGPSMAAPGYDLYYLNVMAGPAEERVWATCDDPAHAWVRDTWTGQPADARLPLTTKAELVTDQSAHPPFGTNLTYPLERYVRVHQTSGTSGAPLRWLEMLE